MLPEASRGFGRIEPDERSRVFAFIPLFLASFVFFSLYQQVFTVLSTYSDARLDRTIFGWEMPISWVSSVNPVYIIVLSPLFALMWIKLGSRQPSSPGSCRGRTAGACWPCSRSWQPSSSTCPWNSSTTATRSAAPVRARGP